MIHSAYDNIKPDLWDSGYGDEYGDDERHGNYRRDGYYGNADGSWDHVVGGFTVHMPAPPQRPSGYQVRGGAFDEHGALHPALIANLRTGAPKERT